MVSIQQGEEAGRWKVDKALLSQLRNEQKILAERVSIEDDFGEIKLVAGVDVGYPAKKAGLRREKEELVVGAGVVMNYKTFKVVEELSLTMSVDFPYIPTYLSFREKPVLKSVLSNLKNKPDVVMVDGNGILHPLGIGIASHIGVEMDIPTIGIAKKYLCGEVRGKGRLRPVILNGEVRGYAFLPFHHLKRPIYISPGHKISLESALEITKKFCFYRIPEPVRRAHILSKTQNQK